MGNSQTTVEMMEAVPTELRDRIVSGMRWTLWLSILAVPFSYGTSLLLARTGPEVIGTYGLLMVYVGVVSSLLYFGGDAVVIKFAPELETHRRMSFLLSYFLVILGTLFFWLPLAALWPESLRYLFGERGGPRFHLFILWFSPLYILFSLVVAALKSVLEMRWAHILLRTLTIGSFAIYTFLFFAYHGLLATQYAKLIWGVFFGLITLGTLFGLRHLLRSAKWNFEWRGLRLFLPRGFWRYTLYTEQASVVRFFMLRLDLILVLNFGGLALLGKYVVIVSLAEIIRTANHVFTDTLLPSLTNLFASGNPTAASEVFSLNLRILFVVHVAATCALMFLVGPMLTLLGPHYISLRELFVLMLLFAGLSAPGAVGGTLLTSVAKQQRAVWVGVGQLALFIVLFMSLWPRWQLGGAVVASGASEFLSNLVLLAVARFSSPVRFSATRDYVLFAIFGVAASLIALRFVPLNPFLAITAWAGAVGLFLLLAHYTVPECGALIFCFIPLGSLPRKLSRGSDNPYASEPVAGSLEWHEYVLPIQEHGPRKKQYP